MIFKNISRRKGRTSLTLAGIAIGVAAMIALGALADGLATGYQAMAGHSQADFVLSQADIYDMTLSAVNEQIGEALLTLPEVRQVAGTLMGNVSAAEGAKYFFVFGHDPASFAIEHFRVIRGEDLSARGVKGRPLLLGKMAVEALDVDVGDTIQLTGGTFRVVGVYETGDAFEDGGAVISLADAQAMLQKPRLVSAYYIQLKDTALSDRFRARIARRYPDLALSTATEFGSKQQIVDIYRGLAAAVGVMAIIVGGVGMTNTVLMSVFERTREIGVLRAVGWRRRVLRLILGESLVLALVGGGIGIALGVGIVYGIRNVPLYGVMRGQLSLGLFLEAGSVALVLGLLGGLYPAWRASKMLPLEAMRYDGGRHTTGNGLLGIMLGGLAFKNLFRRKMRTVLTLVAIGIGIGSVVSLNGIVSGVFDQLNTIVSGSNSHLMAIEAGVSDMGYSAIDESVGARLAAHPDIAHVSGAVVGLLMDIPEVPYFVLWGYHPQEAAISRFQIVDGEPLRANRQVVLGRAFADTSGKQVGDTIRLGDSAFRVVGIFETGTPFEEIGGLLTRRDTQMIAGKPHQVSWYSIELRDPDKLDEVMAWMENAVPEIEVSVTAEFTENLPDLESSRAMMGGLAVLMALVGSVGMTNTILMSVLERTQEIGVLRALGWSRWRVMMMILKESLLMAAVGGLSGIVFGIFLAQLFERWPGIGELLGEATFSPALLGQAMVVALVLGALGGLYPAWRATRLSPVEALRYE